jgi:integrase
MRRLRYVMERFGITKRDLHVVPHGLRHQFAADRYHDETGHPPPVAGGPAVPAAVDAAARRGVSILLGHGRTQITNAYLSQATAMHSKSSERSGPPAAAASPPSA